MASRDRGALLRPGVAGLCATSALWLYRLVHQPPTHDPKPLECLAALIAFLGWSLGWSFLFEGPGLFKLIDVPTRHWRSTL